MNKGCNNPRDDYEKKWLQASHDFDRLQAAYRCSLTANEALRRQVEAFHKQQAACLSAKQRVERTVHELGLELELMKENAVLDRRVRTGQARRMRIVEHRLLEALDESMKERQQRIKSEERAVQLSKALNRERARRLHDLHQQSRISSESLAAMQREKAMEGRCSSAEDDAQSVARTCGLLETGMIANQHITSEGTHTQMRQERAIEWSHAERVMLKSALQESRGYSLKMRLENQFLRAELYTRLTFPKLSHGRLKEIALLPTNQLHGLNKMCLS